MLHLTGQLTGKPVKHGNLLVNRWSGKSLQFSALVARTQQSQKTALKLHSLGQNWQNCCSGSHGLSLLLLFSQIHSNLLVQQCDCDGGEVNFSTYQILVREYPCDTCMLCHMTLLAIWGLVFLCDT